jgi:D-sedoheptulose 7-phosphate isomerase
VKLGTVLEETVLGAMRDAIAVTQSMINDHEYQVQVATVGQVMVTALAQERKVLFFGNGGSAADAQHLAAELAGRFMTDRPGLAGVALTTNTSSMTAIANDYSFDEVFSRQIEGLGLPGDIAFGISTSGNSRNVIRAMQAAQSRKMVTVALTGEAGGELRHLVNHCIRVPSPRTPRVQEAHILTGHILCQLIEQEMFEQKRSFFRS